MMHDDDDDFAAERAYHRAVQQHHRAQAHEDRDTGAQLDPLPAFEQWLRGAHDEESHDDTDPIDPNQPD
jgi:hypothetical protein